MTRPTRNQDQLLIDTAKRLLPEMGVAGMSLQKIADESGVNLGMFHYHFKTKAAFIRKVLESINAEIEKELFATAQDAKGNSLERLRQTLILLGLRMLKKKKVIVWMVRDLLNQNEDVAEFVLEVHRHRIAFLRPLIDAATQDGFLEPLPFPQVMAVIGGMINFPTMIAEALESLPQKELKLSAKAKEAIVSEQAVIQRVDLLLKALSRERGSSK